jgi:hypothetical protein
VSREEKNVSNADPDNTLATSLPADPFSSLAVHYGMLLGVPDFEVLMGNARGKLRLHQAWQHGPGVIWGYPVAVRGETAEVVVGPGLAIDGLGREVSLAVEYCVDVAQWLEEHLDEVQPVVDGDARVFNAQVILRYRACLARPVPAMSAGCDAASSGTAYSRVLETGELILRPYPNDAEGNPAPPPDDRDAAFARLRALMRTGALPPDADPPDPPVRDWRHAFRTLAARETRDLAPPAYAATPASSASNRLFPVDEPGEVVLADLPALRIVATAGGTRLEAPTIDQSLRRTHLPTWVIEELLAELASGTGAAVPDPGGPRVADIRRAGSTVTIELTGDVAAGTIAGALSVHSFDATAADPRWDPVDVSGTTGYTPSDPGPPATAATITVGLPAGPTASVSYRLLLRGTGDAPLAGLVAGRPLPLAGRVGGPAGHFADGHDVAEILTT